MSVNPNKIINQIELGTSPLENRINAINKLCEAGYPVGLLIAPVIMVPDWKILYTELLSKLEDGLSQKAKKSIFIEIIFMTYSYVHRMINREAFVNAIELYDKDLMTGRGRGKYCYKQDLRNQGKDFFRNEIFKYLPNTNIEYIV